MTEQMPTMTRTQAVLLMAVAGILRDHLEPNEAGRNTLTSAVDDVAYELAALGIMVADLPRKRP
jgi:hypothetical protein